MTWSPVSAWGAKIGLCLPRRILATSEASRPSTTPSASMTYQRRSMSRGFGEKVFIGIQKGGRSTADTAVYLARFWGVKDRPPRWAADAEAVAGGRSDPTVQGGEAV